MVPTTKPIADFHRQVTAHVGRTIQKQSNHFSDLTVFLYIIYFSLNLKSTVQQGLKKLNNLG